MWRVNFVQNQRKFANGAEQDVRTTGRCQSGYEIN